MRKIRRKGSTTPCLAVGVCPARPPAELLLEAGLQPRGERLKGRPRAGVRHPCADQVRPVQRVQVGDLPGVDLPALRRDPSPGRLRRRRRGHRHPGHVCAGAVGAHPRWRGAHSSRCACRSARSGSSPLARGARQPPGAQETPTGLIPAGAGRTTRPPRRRSSRRAHPRWRGAHDLVAQALPVEQGSSPLARGARHLHDLDAAVAGLIPAGAGRTPTRSSCPRAGWAHPRWRGAHAITQIDSTTWSGSSPLARGARLARSRPAGGRPAHPRWRGAHVTGRKWIDYVSGSSPLARGARRRPYLRRQVRGLIPAGAGRTARWPGGGWWRPAHPRWRGAHSTVPKVKEWSVGSSPLARGAHRPAPERPHARGLIPAGAGRTTSPRRTVPRGRAHPRWRGAHGILSARASMPRGSSPLARGARTVDRTRHGRPGLIPAGAGRTDRKATRASRPRAHPRWRGAHFNRDRMIYGRAGSSPLARGARRAGTFHVRLLRLIPAGAGRTPPGAR